MKRKMAKLLNKINYISKNNKKADPSDNTPEELTDITSYTISLGSEIKK
jgi:hypothetical protein